MINRKKKYGSSVSIKFTARHSAEFKNDKGEIDLNNPDNHEHEENWTGTVYFKSDCLVDDIIVNFDEPRELAKQLDGKYLNELPQFKGVIPTTERVAEWFYDTLPVCCWKVVIREKCTTSAWVEDDDE